MNAKINHNELSEKDLSNIFELLKHPLRREILRNLSQNSQLYSSILKSLNIRDSSLLNYHLRKMDNLLIKKNVTGEYELNETGKICSQLILKVREKEKFDKFTILHRWIKGLNFNFLLSQLIISPLIIMLIVELFFLNIISFSFMIQTFISSAILSVIFNYTFEYAKKKLPEYLKINMIGQISFLFNVMVLIATIYTIIFSPSL